MDFSFDLFQIYRQYCDIISAVYANESQGYGPDDESESQKLRCSREALVQLLEVVEAKVNSRFSILEEAYKLMSKLELTADFSEFSRFYDFVFFISRENGQKSITVSRAIMAWRLVLAGRFRLLNQWCNFIEENQQHNISEDTWRQVLAFSRCVHENLEGYDPEGAWPVLIDDFVEHMYRMRGINGTPHLFCNCVGSKLQQYDETLTGLKNCLGSKRKSRDNMQIDQESADDEYAISNSNIASSKRRLLYLDKKTMNWDWNQLGRSKDSISPYNNCTKSPCAVEGCLSKGFAGLFSTRSCSEFDQDRRVSYT